ncbi:hypothetical protein CY34DRAFT_727972 [Suillus luteus UH-Slu-Lm8-n1]|uniref:Uncharacterized protein n=1 Tax=Suillus luteus UH-Slu-Lm8-n1 TaxID=930992 RepID=A0A0D0AMR6_9AGAM|nr:hypothetical protein CY34DRAFT_727972 [Suillus luteus UH-Slu-Lm8-n1]
MVLQATGSATQYMLLTQYKLLLNYYVERTDQHIFFLASQSHFKSLPCTESDIRNNNEPRFRLYNATKGVCGCLVYFKTSTCVIYARTSCCQAHISDCNTTCRAPSTPLGKARTLAFRDPGVHLLLLPASREMVELSVDGYREWHDELRVSYFVHALIDELRSYEVDVEANWLEQTLTSRLISSAEESDVVKRSYSLLHDVRDATFNFVQDVFRDGSPGQTERQFIRAGDVDENLVSSIS